MGTDDTADTREGRTQFTLRIPSELHRRLLIDAGAHGRTNVTEHITVLLDAHVPAYTEILTATPATR